MSFNQTTKILYSLIFEQGSLDLLRRVGLINAYLDDYGARKKYKNCIFFLFKVNDSIIQQRKDGLEVRSFLASIVEFMSFYDFYETEEGWMFVFKYNVKMKADVQAFRESRFEDFSSTFKEVVCPTCDKLKENPIKIDADKEIYRYEKEEG